MTTRYNSTPAHGPKEPHCKWPEEGCLCSVSFGERVTAYLTPGGGSLGTKWTYVGDQPRTSLPLYESPASPIRYTVASLLKMYEWVTALDTEPVRSHGRDSDVTSGFFEPGRTYQRTHHGWTITFHVRHVDTAPDGSYRAAFGWRTDPDGGWMPGDADDIGGWTEVHEAETGPDSTKATSPNG